MRDASAIGPRNGAGDILGRKLPGHVQAKTARWGRVGRSLGGARPDRAIHARGSCDRTDVTEFDAAIRLRTIRRKAPGI